MVEKAPATTKANATTTSVYPSLQIKNNDNPSRLLNFPIFGPIIKLILLIPVFIYAWVISIGFVILWMITPFAILFTGKYWDTAYRYTLGYLRITVKLSLYIYGITDKYPGFNMSDNGVFSLTVDKPEHPSRLLAFPVLGIVIRMILLIPFLIWIQILSQGASFAYFIATFAIVFKRKYPESLFEFTRDSISRSLASTIYTSYLTDKYPSFKISMNHKNVKIALIIAGILLTFANIATQPSAEDYERDLQDQSLNETMYDSTQDASGTYSDF